MLRLVCSVEGPHVMWVHVVQIAVVMNSRIKLREQSPQTT